MENYTNAVIVEITEHSNFIVGYKEGEVVVIAVSPDLSEYDNPIVFNKDNGSNTETRLGYCRVYNEKHSFQFEPITYAPGIAKGAKHSVAITQSGSEVAEFRNFFKKGLQNICIILFKRFENDKSSIGHPLNVLKNIKNIEAIKLTNFPERNNP